MYGDSDTPIAITASLAQRLRERPPIVAKAMQKNAGTSQFLRLMGSPIHMYAVPLHNGGAGSATLLVVHDAAYIADMSWRAWKEMSFRVLFQVALIVLFTLLIFQRAFFRPLARTTAWMREIRHGRTPPAPAPTSDMLRPLASEASTLRPNFRMPRQASAQKEAQLRVNADASWTAERLAISLHGKLEGSRLFIVANREPYMHKRDGRIVKTIVPASGLVTALEPVLNACDGTWIAHGSGNADRENCRRA